MGVLLLVFVLIANLSSHNPPHKIEETKIISPFEKIFIDAKAVFVYDITASKTLYAKNQDERLPLASLTKVMSALVASELAPSNKIITITREAVATEGDSGLYIGERWYLKDLIDFSLISSANDGVKAIALNFDNFVNQMNIRANTIGMKNTYFINETGLDERVSGGAYGTARDMTTLFEYILRYHPDVLAATREPMLTFVSLSGLTHTVQNTDTVINQIPGIIASKTGYTDIAGGNLVVAFDPEIGRPIIVSVLGSSGEGRFSDMLTLIKASMESLQNSVK